MCGIDIERVKNPELKISDIRPIWTVLYNKEAEASTYIVPDRNKVPISQRAYEFYWDNETAHARYDELEKLGKVPTKKPFDQNNDYKYIYRELDCDILRIHQIKGILIAMMKAKFPDCGDNYSIFINIWTDGDFMVECRHGRDFDHPNGSCITHSLIFDNNEIIHETRNVINNIVDETSIVKTKIK